MQINALQVNSFRIFKKKRIELKAGINLISGRNAVGKTTLLEALYLMITGRSFRTPQLIDLVHKGDPFFRIESHFHKCGVLQQIKIAAHKEEKKILYNNTELSSFSALLGIMPGVLLAPHDIELVKGLPECRRRFLDLQLAQVDPLYVHHLLRYTRGLKQRNWMLKSKKLSALDSYDELLAPSAAYILEQRGKVTVKLEKEACSFYQLISGKSDQVSLHYHSSLGPVKTPKDIVDKLRVHRFKECEIGYTTAGPHRDDLKLILNQNEAKQFASEGEMRSLASSLRLAEWELMRLKTHEKPLFLVDDFGMSLDEKRLEHLEQIFQKMGQVILTSARFPKSFENCHFFLL